MRLRRARACAKWQRQRRTRFAAAFTDDDGRDDDGRYYFLAACCFLRSAQRFFIASAMRRRPSAVMVRLRGFTADFFLLDPRFGDETPASSARASFRRAISLSSSATILLTSTIPPFGIPHLTGATSSGT